MTAVDFITHYEVFALQAIGFLLIALAVFEYWRIRSPGSRRHRHTHSWTPIH